jgi:hypothetical protein
VRIPTGWSSTFLNLVHTVTGQVFLARLSSNFFDCLAVKENRRVKSVGHGISTFVCLLVLLVVPVPVVALLSPLVTTFLVVIFFAVSIFLLFILAVFTSLLFLVTSFPFRLSALLHDLSLLVLLLLLRQQLLGLFLIVFFLLLRRLLFLLVVGFLASPAFLGLSVDGTPLSKGLTREVLAELGNDRVAWETTEELSLDPICHHVVLLLQSHQKL